MLRRSILGLLAAVVLLVVLAPSVGAAPAPQEKWGPVQLPLSPVWGWKPHGGTGLDYRFEYSEDSSELLLYALNPTRKDITVNTPGKTKVEFVLWQGNRIVWRSGQGEGQRPGGYTERFRPGEGKIYRQSLPSLQAGTYFV